MSGGIFISSSTDFGSSATPITIDGMPNGTGLQILRRNSANNAIEFVNLSSILPSGTALQSLRKNSANTDFEFASVSSDSPADSQFASTTKTDTTTTRSITDSEFTSPTTATATSALASENTTIDFSSSTGWTLSGSPIPTISSGQLNYNNSEASSHAIYDLGASFSSQSGTSFKIRIKFTETFTAQTPSAGNGRMTVFGLSNNTTVYSTKFIALSRHAPNTGWVANCEYAGDMWNSAVGYGSPAFHKRQHAFSGSSGGTPITKWIEIERTSSSAVTFRIYTNSSFTTLESTISFTDVNSLVSDLRYFIVVDPSQANRHGTMLTQYDDLVIFNTITYNATNVTGGGAGQSKTTPTNERWQTSSSEINPSITVDMNTAQELLGVAIYPHSNTNITSFKIETSSDNVTFLRRKTLNYSSLTVDAYNFIYFPRPTTTTRYLKLTGLDASAKTFSINKVIPLVLTESEINRRHRIINYAPNDTASTLTGA